MEHKKGRKSKELLAECIRLNMKTGWSMLKNLQIEDPVQMEQGLCQKSPLAPLY
jgi:hypothetical protein